MNTSSLSRNLGCLCSLAVLFLAMPARAGDVVMVLNARNPTQELAINELKAIYLGQTSFWHGVVPMKVFTRPAKSAATTSFLEEQLQISVQKLERTWTAKQLAGQGIAPTELAEASEVVAGVAANPGAIGFLTAEEAWGLEPNGVKYVQLD